MRFFTVKIFYIVLISLTAELEKKWSTEISNGSSISKSIAIMQRIAKI